MLPRLIVLDERPLPPGEQPGGAFLLRVLDLEAACGYVLDATTGTRSTDRAAWREHCRRTHGAITRGRELSSERASKIATERHENEPGLEAHWKSLKGKPVYRRVRQHWTDPEVPNAREAIESAPDEAGELRFASRRMWVRIFGGRRGQSKNRATRRGSA